MRLQPEHCAGTRKVGEDQGVEAPGVPDEKVLLALGAIPVELETLGVSSSISAEGLKLPT